MCNSAVVLQLRIYAIYHRNNLILGLTTFVLLVSLTTSVVSLTTSVGLLVADLHISGCTWICHELLITEFKLPYSPKMNS